MGPWHHGQEIDEGSSLGQIKFGSDTAAYFRREILAPFLAHYLKDDQPKMDVSPVTAFETGTNVWRRMKAYPSEDRAGRSGTPLYLGAGMRASFVAPQAGDAPYDEYVSDPAKPVPYRARPSQQIAYDLPLPWPRWLVDDQREASGRPDVLAYSSDRLKSPVTIMGHPIANLVASTSGTDSDWVMKLIDVYPDEVAGDAALGGYQLAVSMDIFRGRYRDGLETPKALTPDAPLPYKWALPYANHVFLPGHRIMVQIQSSWFPLYDRNPQTFVPSIFSAKAEDYRKATQRVYHAPGRSTLIELPVVSR